jgi:hypothetical protein
MTPELKEVLEAMKGLLWLATPHFSDKTQMDHLERCQKLIDRYEGEDDRRGSLAPGTTVEGRNAMERDGR